MFTPDANEVDVITEQYESVAAFAAETGAVVVSTGGANEIHAGGERWTNETGTPEMTVGGATRTPASSPRSSDGAWIALRPPGPVSGSSGAPASGHYSIGMRAMDVIESIPRVLVDHRESAPGAQYTGGSSGTPSRWLTTRPKTNSASESRLR